MKRLKLLLTQTSSRYGILCWILICVSAGQHTDTKEIKKTPQDLVCYQNYTLVENFCYCSWRPGEEAENPSYTLRYCLHREEEECDDFDANKETSYILTNDIVHMKRNISISVIAEETGQKYPSEVITLILDKAVKLDPADHRKTTITRKGGDVTLSWTRSHLFPAFLNTRKEVRYKEHSSYPDPLPCRSSPPSSLLPGRSGIPIYKEHCTFALDGRLGHYAQIRQKYEEGVWSEWSDPVFVPAEIGPVQIEEINTKRLNLAGIRKVLLRWNPGSKEDGDVKYLINVTFLACSEETRSHSTNHSWFHTNISGAAYNVSITASNQAQTASPWSEVIEEDWAAIPFQNVTLSGNNLTMKWKGKKAGKSSYCITYERKEEIRENVTNNHATVLTDDFLPMKCYKISIHKMSKSQMTVGTTYYLKPLLSEGPRNLTVINVTANSILLKWDPLDLQECQGILQNWIITRKDHESNISQEIYEDSSVTRHLAEGLPPGFNYTFEVKGITIFGEQTGSSSKSVFNPQTVENTNKKLPEKIVGILIGLLLAALVIMVSWFKIKHFVCQELPNPSKSNAATFTPSDNKYTLSPQHLVDTSSEEKSTEPLIIENNIKIEAIETAEEETQMLDPVSTKKIFDNELVMTEGDTDVDADLQFEYRKQVAPMTPVSEKDAGDHFFEKLKDNLPLGCPKENEALLSPNDVNISTGES